MSGIHKTPVRGRTPLCQHPLRELADLLEIKGSNPFRIRAYRNAVPTVEGLTRLEGMGPKKARKLWDELDITTVDELEAAIQAGSGLSPFFRVPWGRG